MGLSTRRIPLYERLARRYALAIEAGALRAGDRLPSIRALRAQDGVSTATVIQALARLESLGLVEARPRLGTFVRPHRALPAPQPTRPEQGACAVTHSALIARVLTVIGDERLVPLGISSPSPSLLPAEQLARAASAVFRGTAGAALRYEPAAGCPQLRRTVARRALTWGFAARPEEVIITAGASEAIHLALSAVARPGDAVAIESPAHYTTFQALEALDLKAIEVPCRPDTGLDLDALGRILRRRRVAAVLAVPSYSNPLGSCMPESAKRRLVAMLAERGVPLVEDDVYGDVGFARRPPAAKAFDRQGEVLLCGSFSKTVAPGWRVGYVLAGRYHEDVLLRKFALNVTTSSGPQRAIARFLDSGAYDRHLRRLRTALSESATRMRHAVARSFPVGTRVSKPTGGYGLWVELPKSVDALALYSAAVEEGVSLVPGHLFGLRDAFRNFVRLSYGHRWSDELQVAVQKIGRIACRMAQADADTPPTATGGTGR
ncbi:aminotransferase-like domain-containing protein [Anaeromyxobacter soli]|uniref:aminotransferase-like domain-containing protein n=1 Tax=Anaeromyxobacter soli TaxID=2922725 RepID=UPI001FAF5950|nr:PLP-dependent aminotransferase family protein [Anaeromyxobacter sp. SG29]